MKIAGQWERTPSMGNERPRGAGWFAGTSRFLAGASLGGIFAATLDSAWARGVEDQGHVAFARLWLLDIGLIAPISFLLGVASCFASRMALPGANDPIAGLVRRWRSASPTDKRLLAAMLAPLSSALIVWMTLTAHWARYVLAVCARGGDASALMVVGTVGLAGVAAASVVALGLPIWRFLERRQAHAKGQGLVVATGLVLAAGLWTWGIASGPTSGAHGWFGIWGVLRRPELDLRAPGLLAAIGAFSLVGSTLLSGQTWPKLRGLISGALVVLPWPLLGYAAVTMAPDASETTVIEQAAPLGRASLKALRRASDRDHDGASALFGGGDCNDHDAQIGPGALDLPGNGVDEDCSGEDARAERPGIPRQNGHTRPTPSVSLPDDLNVVLITIDTLRADLGYAGNPRPVSPNIDALATRSVVFERAYSLASYTGKSLGPLLSGKYPSETHRGWGHFNKYPREDTMVAERLKAAGVHTIGVHAHYYFTPPFGLARGFDTWDVSAIPHGAGHDEDATITGDKLTEAALRVLSDPRETKSRFFAWIHYFDPHSEYAKHPGAPDFGTNQRALYDGEVWFVDQQLGRILSFVQSQPWGRKTAIVLTSDHGEAFGEHHMIRHGFELWEELVRVPLLFSVPGAPPHRVSARRSGIDLVPTLLDLFNLPAPPGDRSDFLSGRTLLPDLFATDPRGTEVRDVFVDMPAGPNNDERRAFIHGDLKLSISNGVRYQLFDLSADPGEKNDLMRDKDLAGPILARYRDFKTTLREVYVKPQPKTE